ncbi:MAG: bi-domain-containing oxidoreductase [Gemmatimonadales bacterium]
MLQVLQHVGSGKLEVAEVPEPSLRAGGVLVRNTASLISLGTERSVVEFAAKSLIGKARERPDLVRQVLDKVRRDGIGAAWRTISSRLDRPVALGYSCAGRVLEVGAGADEYAAGMRVACAGQGYASHAEVVWVPRNLSVPIPEGVSDEDAAYVTAGAIALQGFRIADLRMGETAVVIGLGLLGLLTVQLLNASGCRVIGIDLDAGKVRRAKSLGVELSLDRSADVGSRVTDFTNGYGADGVIITAATESHDPIELAGELARDRGRVTVVGAVGMQVPRKRYYEKELEVRLSRSYGPGRYDPLYEEAGIDFPFGYVRWTERRNMAEFLRLVGEGKVTPARLTSHRFPISRALEAYALVSEARGQPVTGVVLTYPAGDRPSRRSIVTSAHPAAQGTLQIGFIGAGNFAQAVLLPELKRIGGVSLSRVVTANGASAKQVASRFGFRSAGTDPGEVFADPDIDAVIIATRHRSHAEFATQALRAGKAVLVEKPLAIDEAGLAGVVEAARENGRLLAVGFNRRFAPLAVELRAAFEGTRALSMVYRVNAGSLPPESWIQFPSEGGRIVGEVCHFIDLLAFLSGERPVEVFAHGLSGPEVPCRDSLTASVRFTGGSVAALAYLTTGDRRAAKERVEVFGSGQIAVLEEFRSVLITRGGRRRRRRLLRPDKGFRGELNAFLRAVRTGAPPISLESLIATTRATFAILTSLRTGTPQAIAAD